jgi:polysaccharide export outer membrane protein
MAQGSQIASVAEITAQEQLIFKARQSALERQLQNLSELRSLLTREIEVLGKKSQALEDNVKLTEGELRDIKSLVERGIATVSRRSELERVVASLKGDHLDQITAAMRARQTLSEAARNEASLRDQFQTEVATELQQVHATIERLKIREDILKKTLVLTAATASDESRSLARTGAELSFIIIRNHQGRAMEFAASEATLLMPSDVLKVAVQQEGRKRAGGSVNATIRNF